MASMPPPGDAGTLGVVEYMAQSARHSLYRNGEVLTRRDLNGSDAGTVGVFLEKREMTIHDARGLEEGDRRRVEANGFELLSRPLASPVPDFLDHDQVVGEYYPECAHIVRAATGASQVFAFDHNIRSAAGEKSKRRITGGQQVQGPAHLAHGDYTLVSGPQRLRDLANPPTVNDTLRSVLRDGQSLLEPTVVDRILAKDGRFALINVWRNIAEDPVATHPLALCDAQSVHPQDLVVFEIHYQDRVGENYFAKHSLRHRWYYYPAMTRDEALLIKQWDSAGHLARTKGAHPDAGDGEAPCTFSFHTAFEDPSTPSHAPRALEHRGTVCSPLCLSG